VSIYLNNYWALYSEFINIFKNLKYREIPLALVTNFYQQINDELRGQMEQVDFSSHLKYTSIKELKEIQPFFEESLRSFRKPIKKNPEGKMVINLDYTRLPEKTFKEYFPDKGTIVVSRSKKTDYLGFQNEYIENFKMDTVEASKRLVRLATGIFSKYSNHPAYGNSFFVKTFLNRIPLIVDGIEKIFTFYQKVPTSVVIIGTTEDVISRSFALVGLLHGIPCICLQHGILMGEEAFMPVFSSHVGVYGDYERNWYLHRGVQDERIITLGHPRYDHLFTYSPPSKDTVMKKYKLDTKKVTLLLATGPSLNPSQIGALIKGLSENQMFQVLLKPHPWELAKNKTSLYTDLEKNYKFLRVIIDRKVDTNELVSISDGVVSSLSTVALEALLQNKPAFVYYFIQSNREYDYYNSLGKYLQKNPDELIKAITSYYTNKQEREEYEEVKKNFLKNSYTTSESSQVLLEFIQKIAGE
jgi:hypothetical protein